MMDTVDGEYQNCKAFGGAYTREHFFGKTPETLAMVSNLSDDDIWRLNRGGHDLFKIYAAYDAAVRHTGIVRTDVAQRLSLLLSLLAAFVLFGEQAGAQKLLGLALGLCAVVGILARPDPHAAPGRNGWLLLLTVWVGFAVVDVMLKRLAMAGTPSAAALLVAFALAFAGMLAWQGWRWWRQGMRPGLRHIGAGLLLGLVNFGNIVFYIRAHQALPDSPAVVFATMNIGVVVVGTAVGVLAFGEKTSRLNRIAIVLAVVAIALIALAPKG